MRSKTLSPGATPASAINGPGLRRASAASRWALRFGSASAWSSAGCEKWRGASALLQPASKSAAKPIASPNLRMMTSGAKPSTRRSDRQSLHESLRETLGGFDLRRGDEAGQLFMSESAGAKETLVKVAAPFDEQRQLRGALDAFDHDLELELPRELDQRAHNDPVAASANDVGNQTAVDFQHV